MPKASSITRKTWQEFQGTGLLWWINSILHIFGWAIVMECYDDGGIKEIYPARTRFRGFSKDTSDIGFKRLTDYMVANGGALQDEVWGDDTNQGDKSAKDK
jgi:hypothetical protein